MFLFAASVFATGSDRGAKTFAPRVSQGMLIYSLSIARYVITK